MYGTIICLVFLKVYLLHHVVEGCSQCMAGRQVEASEGRKEGALVGRTQVTLGSSVTAQQQWQWREGGREATARPTAEGGVACKQAACLLLFVRLPTTSLSELRISL